MLNVNTGQTHDFEDDAATAERPAAAIRIVAAALDYVAKAGSNA